MKRIYPTVIALFWGLTIFANNPSESDTTELKNLIDVDIVSTYETKPTAKIIPERINTLNSEKNTICAKIGDYKKVIQRKRKKELVLSSTGYFKPSISLGLGEIKSVSDRFCKKVDKEIEFIMAFNDLDYSIANSYVKQLKLMQEQVESEYEKVPSILYSKIK